MAFSPISNSSSIHAPHNIEQEPVATVAELAPTLTLWDQAGIAWQDFVGQRRTLAFESSATLRLSELWLNQQGVGNAYWWGGLEPLIQALPTLETEQSMGDLDPATEQMLRDLSQQSVLS